MINQAAIHSIFRKDRNTKGIGTKGIATKGIATKGIEYKMYRLQKVSATKDIGNKRYRITKGTVLVPLRYPLKIKNIDQFPI